MAVAQSRTAVRALFLAFEGLVESTSHDMPEPRI